MLGYRLTSLLKKNKSKQYLNEPGMLEELVMANYDKTPSFYNDEETFMKYLGMSSYYVALQNAVSKIIKYLNPENILELGSGTGATVLKLAKQYEKIKFKAIDMCQEMVYIGAETSKKT